MKRYFVILFAALTLCGTVAAQQADKTILGAKVDVVGFEYEADSVRVDLEYNLEGLKIGSNESVIFAPKIFKEENTLSLPTLVVRRRGSVKSYNRAMVLGGEQSAEMYDELYGEPYKIIPFYGSDKQTKVQFSFKAPYERWMVDAQLYVDCSTYGCCAREDNGMLIPHDNALRIDIPKVDVFDVKPAVELIKPEKVAIKRRDIHYSSALIFKVNSTYINPALGGNEAELASIDEMMQSVISDSDYTITDVNIIGYASPEGTLANNMRLSKGRAMALENLMKQKYTMIKPELYNVEFGGENWDKLYELVSDSDIEYRDEVLDIIDNISIANGRESKLMALNNGETYRYLLRNIFPATRLVLVEVKFNIDAYDLVRISELIDTKPQNLSLEEMYRLSETYQMEDSEFEKIFLTAVMVYPDDEVAQNNALVTEIRRGNAGSLDELADSVSRDTNSAELANSLGAYYMISGDYNAAQVMLQRAAELGSARAEENMSMLKMKLANLQQQQESDALRVKIYGE